jgi:N-lysine methyltransferase SETD6
VLPRQLDSLVFWSDAELAELQASTVVNKIGKAGAEDMFSKHIVPLGLEGCDGDMCHRVASIIMAYAFDIPEDVASKEEDGNTEGGEDDLVSDEGDEKTVLSMIPLADMLNADADRNNARLCCDNEELEMRTIKPIRKGEEIFNDYGQLPRSDLLRRYGYVTENYAAFDVAELSTRSIFNAFETPDTIRVADQSLAPLEQEQLKTRIELAEREGVYEESYDICHPGLDGPSIPDELLALLYLLLLDEESLASISNSQSTLPSRSKLATELVGQVLVVLLRARESEYATTIEEDETLSQARNLSRRGMMALEVRLGEKRVLRNAIQEASTMSGSNKRMRLVPNLQQSSEPHVGPGKRRAEETSTAKKKGRFR